ncbi:MAG: rod shape-determining protein MreC, partial [Victivallales bacterium]|nr:rod shape-determining protein MreC [Victivallales bacterium]
ISVLDPRFCLSGFLAQARTHGIINGDSRREFSSEGIELSFLSVRKEFKPGDKCFTSGFEHHVPAGLLIGVLEKLNEKPQIYSNSLYLSAVLQPAAQLDRLHFVVIAIPAMNRN